MNDYEMARQLTQVYLKSEQTPTRQMIQEKLNLFSPCSVKMMVVHLR